MSSSSTAASLALAIGLLLIGVVSCQCGASLATHLFPIVGAQGATAYRLGFSVLILLLWRRPWRRWGGRRDWRAMRVFRESGGGTEIAPSTGFALIGGVGAGLVPWRRSSLQDMARGAVRRCE